MHFEEREFLPVILGADITAYSLARSFHEEYHIKSLVLSMSEGGYIANSDIIENRIFPGLEKKEVLVERLLEIGKGFEGKKKLIVLGCGDWYVRALIESKKVLEPYYIVPYIDEDLLNKIVLKDKFYEIFEELGLDYPETYVYECGKENDLKFNFKYPVIAKPANSAMYHCAKFEGKKKVYFLNNAEEYRRVINGMKNAGYNGNLIIQEFIPGGDDAMRVVNTYSGKDGKTLAASLGQPVLEEYSPATLGNYAAIIPRSDDIGYTGFANFDMKYDRRTGRYMLFEINCRPGRSSFYVRGAGLNLMKLMTDDTVYGKRPDGTVFTHDTALWTAVPKGVLKKYVKDPVLKNEILSLWRQGRVFRSLFNRGDMALRRRLRIFRYYLSYYKSFSRYYFDKDGNE